MPSKVFCNINYATEYLYNSTVFQKYLKEFQKYPSRAIEVIDVIAESLRKISKNIIVVSVEDLEKELFTMNYIDKVELMIDNTSEESPRILLNMKLSEYEEETQSELFTEFYKMRNANYISICDETDNIVLQ